MRTERVPPALGSVIRHGVDERVSTLAVLSVSVPTLLIVEWVRNLQELGNWQSDRELSSCEWSKAFLMKWMTTSCGCGTAGSTESNGSSAMYQINTDKSSLEHSRCHFGGRMHGERSCEEVFSEYSVRNVTK